MKKQFFFFLGILLIGTFAYGGRVFKIEAIGYYFQPSDKAFKNIYGSGISYGGEISITIWKWISILAGGNYYYKKGKTSFAKEETEIQIIPLYGGIKLQLPNSNISPYAGFGIGYFTYKETSLIGKVEEGNIGYIGQLGCLIKIAGGLFLDIKGSYSYCKVKPVDIEADLGGLKAGIGLGFEF